MRILIKYTWSATSAWKWNWFDLCQVSFAASDWLYTSWWSVHILKSSRVSRVRFRIKLQLRTNQSPYTGKQQRFGIFRKKQRYNGTPLQWFIYVFNFLFVCLFRLGESGLKDCMNGKEAWLENFGLCSLELEVPARSWHFPVISMQGCSWKYVTTWHYLGDINILFSLKIELRHQNLECLTLKPGVKLKWLIA